MSVGRSPLELGRTRLLDADPDLAARLPPAEAALAAARSTVTTFALGRAGSSPYEGFTFGEDQDLCLVVLSGVLVRRIDLDGHGTIELLGQGDVLRPCVTGGEETVTAGASWRVLDPVWLAILDLEFWARLSPWPRISIALLDRVVQRSRALHIQLAIVQVQQLPRRLLLLLWQLADRFGWVGSQGVVRLPLRLTHTVLAELASARRPSISSALKQLTSDGSVVRRADGTLELHGGPPPPASHGRGHLLEA